MTDPAYRYRAYAEDVIDGDTYRLRVDLGFHVGISINGRLRGINCPERGRRGYEIAKENARSLLRPVAAGEEPAKLPTYVMVESYRGARSFDRWIVDVWLPDGRPLAEVLIAGGYGVPFDPKVDTWTR